MKSHLKQIIIICVSLWLLSSIIVTPTEAFVKMDNSQHQLAETDLARVDWKLNHINNPGMEEWTSPHVIDGVSTYRTTEQYTWYAQSPWPVNEGSRSRGFQSRAVDAEHPAEAYMSRTVWTYWNNPVNLTLKFDWYIDQIPQPVDGDYFRIDIELGAPGTHHMYYYFGCSDTSKTNSSNYQYYFINGPLQTWNTFDRNITEDFFGIAGYYPTQFRLFRFYLRTYSTDYSRTFLDDLWMTNTTVIIGGSTGNGNFETGGGWYSYFGDSPADISQSSVRTEGSWSLNMTTDSNGNESRADVEWYPDRFLSSHNPDTFSFQWMLSNYTVSTEDTYAYLSVGCENDTESFYLYYVFCYGENTDRFSFEGANLINVTGFNTTGQWNTFSRSIWSDISSFNQTEYVIVTSVEIRVYNREKGARTTILFDEMNFVSAAMDGMGYEDQGVVGSEIWDSYNGFQPEFTVTDIAHSGSKAANLSLNDGDSWSGGRDFENRFVNDNTDLWLDFFWRIENDTGHEDNLMYLDVYFESGETLAYIFANHSAVPIGNGFDEFIILQEANTVGSWINFQRNLFDDYSTAFGSDPDTEINEFYLYAESGSGARFEILFDDVYLYTDPAPAIIGIQTTPQVPDIDVNVTAVVEDLSSLTVTLHYKIDQGTWNDVVMIDTGNGFNATIPRQANNTEVFFYIEAEDAFGQISMSSNIGYLVTISSTTTLVDYMPLIIGGIIVVVVVGVIMVYYFVIRPKQGAE